jgi:hypothetical protein
LLVNCQGEEPKPEPPAATTTEPVTEPTKTEAPAAPVAEPVPTAKKSGKKSLSESATRKGLDEVFDKVGPDLKPKAEAPATTTDEDDDIDRMEMQAGSFRQLKNIAKEARNQAKQYQSQLESLQTALRSSGFELADDASLQALQGRNGAGEENLDDYCWNPPLDELQLIADAVGRGASLKFHFFLTKNSHSGNLRFARTVS